MFLSVDDLPACFVLVSVSVTPLRVTLFLPSTITPSLAVEVSVASFTVISAVE